MRSPSPPVATQTPTSMTSHVAVLPSLLGPTPLLIPPDIVATRQSSIRYGDPNASPPGLVMIDSPTCYELANLEYSCLGILRNNSDRTIGDTSMLLAAYDASGKILNEQIVTTEQRLVPAHTIASYRAIMQSPTALTDSDIVFTSEFARMYPPDETIATLDIVESNVQVNANGRYRISAIITNNNAETAHDLRLFATLLENKWEIVGYRAIELDNVVSSGESIEIQIEVIPHMLPDHLTHYLHVEGNLRG